MPNLTSTLYLNRYGEVFLRTESDPNEEPQKMKIITKEQRGQPKDLEYG